MAKFIHGHIEGVDGEIGDDRGCAWYAYFEGTPTADDLMEALHVIYPDSKDVDVDINDPNNDYYYGPIHFQNPVADRAGLERWYICQAV
jgi:hypothetical protein